MKKNRPKGLKYKIVKQNNGWFKKGLIPWTASQKGIHLSSKTEFKKGRIYNIPPESLPRGEKHHARFTKILC